MRRSKSGSGPAGEPRSFRTSPPWRSRPLSGAGSPRLEVFYSSVSPNDNHYPKRWPYKVNIHLFFSFVQFGIIRRHVCNTDAIWWPNGTSVLKDFKKLLVHYIDKYILMNLWMSFYFLKNS